jgi:molybdate transport system permease protein
MFAGNMPGVTQTMPLAIYSTLESDPPAAIVLSVTLVAISFLVIIVTKFVLAPGQEGERTRFLSALSRSAEGAAP